MGSHWGKFVNSAASQFRLPAHFRITPHGSPHSLSFVPFADHYSSGNRGCFFALSGLLALWKLWSATAVCGEQPLRGTFTTRGVAELSSPAMMAERPNTQPNLHSAPSLHASRFTPNRSHLAPQISHLFNSASARGSGHASPALNVRILTRYATCTGKTGSRSAKTRKNVQLPGSRRPACPPARPGTYLPWLRTFVFARAAPPSPTDLRERLFVVALATRRSPRPRSSPS